MRVHDQFDGLIVEFQDGSRRLSLPFALCLALLLGHLVGLDRAFFGPAGTLSLCRALLRAKDDDLATLNLGLVHANGLSGSIVGISALGGRILIGGRWP